MSWSVEDLGDAIWMQMRSSPVNKQNRAFFADLYDAFDRADRIDPHRPLVLTGQGSVFSAGLDFEEVFALFDAGSEEAIALFLGDYKALFRRVLTAPRPTVAAVNGHAFAGGAILALCCDVRVGIEGSFEVGLNEVPIGIPMPGAFVEIIRHRLGEPIASEWILWGRAYRAADALRAGFFARVVAPSELREVALAAARELPATSMPAFAASKHALLAPVLERIDRFAAELDAAASRALRAPASKAARAQAREALAGKRNR